MVSSRLNPRRAVAPIGLCIATLAIALCSTFATAAEQNQTPLPGVAKPANPAKGNEQPTETGTQLSKSLSQLIGQQNKLLASKQAGSAKKTYRLLLKDNPSSEVARFLYGRVLGGKKGRQLMAMALEGRLGLDADQYREIGLAWDILARSYIKADDLPAALKAAKHGASLMRNASAYGLVAWIATRLGNDDVAILNYTQSLRQNPRNLPSRHELVQLLLKKNRVVSALKVAKGTLILAPREHRAHLLWGTALAAAGNTTAARSAYQVAIKLADGNPDRVSAVAAALRRIEHAELAEAAIKASLEEAPKHYGLLVNLALIHLDREEKADAIKLLLKAKRAHPRLASTHYLLGLAHLRAKEGGKAARALHAALRCDGDVLDYYLTLGQAYNSIEKHDAALSVLKRAASKFPDEPRAQASYGHALYTSKKNKAAARAYERVLKLKPDDTNARFMLALVYGTRLGQLERAYDLLEEYDRLGGTEPGAVSWLKQLRKKFRR